MARILSRIMRALTATLALVYVIDCGVWQVRAWRGGGMSTVEVTRIVVASLKGNKEEYYPAGTALMDCSESLFPQAGGGACWWLTRHRQVLDR